MKLRLCITLSVCPQKQQWKKQLLFLSFALSSESETMKTPQLCLLADSSRFEGLDPSGVPRVSRNPPNICSITGINSIPPSHKNIPRPTDSIMKNLLLWTVKIFRLIKLAGKPFFFPHGLNTCIFQQSVSGDVSDKAATVPRDTIGSYWRSSTDNSG